MGLLGRSHRFASTHLGPCFYFICPRYRFGSISHKRCLCATSAAGLQTHTALSHRIESAHLDRQPTNSPSLILSRDLHTSFHDNLARCSSAFTASHLPTQRIPVALTAANHVEQLKPRAVVSPLHSVSTLDLLALNLQLVGSLFAFIPY